MTSEEKKALKLRAHALKPVVWLGQQGLTPAVLAEVDLALAAHELIKVKIPGTDRVVRKEIVAQMTAHTNATLVQMMGQIATLYRKNTHVPTHPAKKASPKPKSKIALSRARPTRR